MALIISIFKREVMAIINIEQSIALDLPESP